MCGGEECERWFSTRYTKPIWSHPMRTRARVEYDESAFTKGDIPKGIICYLFYLFVYKLGVSLSFLRLIVCGFTVDFNKRLTTGITVTSNDGDCIYMCVCVYRFIGLLCAAFFSCFFHRLCVPMHARSMVNILEWTMVNGNNRLNNECAAASQYFYSSDFVFCFLLSD